MATDWIALQALAAAEFGRRVAAVTDWDAPTPDSEWTTRDLVTHVVDEQRWIPLLLTGCEYAQAEADLAPIGDDLAAAWAEHASRATAAWRDSPADVPVHLSTDVVPAHEYLAEQTSDITIHTWDLARSTGQDDRLDADRCREMFRGMEPMDEMLRQSGQYGARVAVPDDASWQDKLIGFIGRDPAWTP